MPRKTSATPAYSVHPSVAYIQAIIDNLPEKTGRSIRDWVGLVREQGSADEKERLQWLKNEFKLGSTTAWIIVERAAGRANQDSDPQAYLKAAAGYVEAMYAGPKAALRPIHDALVEIARSLGDDVKVCPCRTIVPLYRNHVFAEIKPTTRTRIDFGYALKGAKKKTGKRLIDTGGLAKGDRITHRIPITSLEGIDTEVRAWLRIAYDLDV